MKLKGLRLQAELQESKPAIVVRRIAITAKVCKVVTRQIEDVSAASVSNAFTFPNPIHAGLAVLTGT